MEHQTSRFPVVGRSLPARARLWGTTCAAGLFTGAAVSIIAFALARYGPSGDGWSFRGNGALSVYTLVPALVAAGWTALVLHLRHHRHWLALGAGAGFVGALLAAADAALLPVFGLSGDRIAGPIVLLCLLAWMGVAPALATRVPVPVTAVPPAVGRSIVAGAIWVAATAAGLIVAGLIAPAGS